MSRRLRLWSQSSFKYPLGSVGRTPVLPPATALQLGATADYRCHALSSSTRRPVQRSACLVARRERLDRELGSVGLHTDTVLQSSRRHYVTLMRDLWVDWQTDLGLIGRRIANHYPVFFPSTSRNRLWWFPLTMCGKFSCGTPPAHGHRLFTPWLVDKFKRFGHPVREVEAAASVDNTQLPLLLLVVVCSEPRVDVHERSDVRRHESTHDCLTCAVVVRRSRKPVLDASYTFSRANYKPWNSVRSSLVPSLDRCHSSSCHGESCGLSSFFAVTPLRLDLVSLSGRVIGGWLQVWCVSLTEPVSDACSQPSEPGITRFLRWAL